jgi:hypothetical protein
MGGDPAHGPQPTSDFAVHKPAVRVQGDADARSGQLCDQLQGEVAAKERFTAGYDRLDDAGGNRFFEDPSPVIVTQIDAALQRAPRRVGVAEAAAQVAGIGQLELRANRAGGRLGERPLLAPAEPPAQPVPCEALVPAAEQGPAA